MCLHEREDDRWLYELKSATAGRVVDCEREFPNCSWYIILLLSTVTWDKRNWPRLIVICKKKKYHEELKCSPSKVFWKCLSVFGIHTDPHFGAGLNTPVFSLEMAADLLFMLVLSHNHYFYDLESIVKTKQKLNDI